MNRNGYSLPELGTPANMPGWAKQMTISSQAIMDAEYLHGPGGLDNFYDQADAWLQTQTITRANSKDPGNYSATPFPMAIPRRKLVAYDENGNMRSDVWAEADPNIHLPQIPAWVPPSTAPPAPFMGGTHPPEVGVSEQTMGQMMAAVMTKLMEIGQDVKAVLAKK